MSTTRITSTETRPTGMTTTTTTTTANTGEGGSIMKETTKVVETVDCRSSAGQGQEERKPVAIVHEYPAGANTDSTAAAAAAAPPLKQD